jgi:hypothetical protein
MRKRSVYSMHVMLVVVIAILLALIAIVPAVGDSSYRSEHLELTRVGDAPLRSGFVENIHVNGPKIYAMERYVLNGAAPDTTYQVTLWAYAAGSGCDASQSAGMPIPTAELTTNVSGNGMAKAQFTPEEVAGFKQMASIWDLRWVLAKVETPDSPAYITRCTTVTLD